MPPDSTPARLRAREAHERASELIARAMAAQPPPKSQPVVKPGGPLSNVTTPT